MQLHLPCSLALPAAALAASLVTGSPATSQTPPSLEAPLTSPGIDAQDQFGRAVLLDGSTALVGAPGAREVHVFERVRGAWNAVDVLAPSDGGGGFGYSLALDGDTLVVGAPWNSSGGQAYVFTRSAGTFTEAAILTFTDAIADSNDAFGTSVTVEGSRIAVGAPFADSHPFAGDGGMAFVYEGGGSSWTPSGTIVEQGGGYNGDAFGMSLSLSAGRVLVGAPYAGASSYPNSGAVYLFEPDGSGGWTQAHELPHSAGSPFGFEAGVAVQLEGTTAIVGATGGWAGDLGQLHGAIVIWEETGLVFPAWELVETIVPTEEPEFVGFGLSFAFDGDTLVAGARHREAEFDNGGAVFVFERTDLGWVQTAKLERADGDTFGAAVALDDGTALIGAPYAPDHGAFAGVAETWDVANSCCGDFYGAPMFARMSDQAPTAQNLRLDAGPSHAGELFWILGSASGTSSGALVPDAYFNFTLQKPFAALPLDPGVGFLDANGRADSSFRTPVGAVDYDLAGFPFHHAYVAIDLLSGELTHVSSAWPVLLVL